ncbi:MAG: enoyl-CoA hydratase/isomerase family protein [Deltaproteobacteria bacterium]|nr:enoyl-CoA hydratase/isomerase family protein [Deltaproteobacteria bacterium]
MAPVILNKQGRRAEIVFNAPDSGNVYGLETARLLWQAVQEIRWDKEVRVVLLRSRGRLFSGGGDIRSFQQAIAENDFPRMIEEFSATLNATILAIRGMDKIFVSLVDGGCAGVGIGLALAADITLVTENAKFVAGYIGIGTVPDGGSSYAVLQALGLPRALDFFLTNGIIDGHQAAEIGLVSRFVAAEKAEDEVEKLLGRLERGPAAALGKTKKLLRQGVNRPLPEYLEMERQGIISCAAGEEMPAGVAAFLAKRPPEFP